MSGNSIFIDTNIVLYLLSGDETIAELLNGKAIFVSFITELELLGFKELDKLALRQIENFLRDVTIIDINTDIKKIAIEFRRSFKTKLPDTIIAASAFHLNVPLFTADKDLAKLDEVKILLYEK